MSVEKGTWFERVISEYYNIGREPIETTVKAGEDDSKDIVEVLNELLKKVSPEILDSCLTSVLDKCKNKYKQHFTEDGLKRFVSEKMRKEKEDVVFTPSDLLAISDILDPYKSRKTGPKDKDLKPIVEYWMFKWRDKLSSGYKPGRQLDGVIDEEVAAIVDWTPDAARIGQQIGLKRVKTARRKYKALIEKMKSSPQDPI